MESTTAAHPPVRVFMASSEMSKPSETVSMAVTRIELPLNDNFQHDPHSGEFQLPTAKTPPMSGNVGRSLSLLNPAVSKPLGPLEQATSSSEVEGLS